MSYLGVLAKETGWTMDFVLWSLPYATGLGIVHAAAVRRGVAMEFVEARGIEGAESDLEMMRGDFERMKESHAEQRSSGGILG